MPPARLAGTAPLSRALGLLAALVLLGACQDPSGVGLGLIGEEGNDPNLVAILPDSLYLKEADDVTGGFANGLLPAQARVLVGALSDAAFGDVSAAAYVDFQPPTTVPSGFRDRTITSATLRLVRDVVYGDSTATLGLALHEVGGTWSPVGAPADTTFEVGDLLGTYDVALTDSVASLALPASWVTENDALLRSDSVVTALDGFRLGLAEGAAGGSVAGFDVTQSRLRLTTAEDTVDYPLREVFTHLERGAAMAPPPDRLVLRDGAAERLAFTIPYDSLGAVAVARAAFRLNADPSLLSLSPYAPPLPDQLVLYAITQDGGLVLIGTASLNEDDDAYYFSGTALTDLVQNAALGATTYVRFEVEPARSPVSLGVVPIVTGPAPAAGEAEKRPRLVLTVVPATG